MARLLPAPSRLIFAKNANFETDPSGERRNASPPRRGRANWLPRSRSISCLAAPNLLCTEE
eukprot:700266-Lingulodinium_polyedra.AAC.1